MIKVSIETRSGTVEIREVEINTPDGRSAFASRIVVICAGGKEYQISKSEFEQAVKPFLFAKAG